MAQLIPDTLDFSAYLRSTEAAVKVRAASAFVDDLVAEFAPPERQPRVAEMFSTKLRDRIAFRPGEVTAWAGYNGHRKSMFTGQVALDLCVSGERVLLASFEMKPAATLARMVRQCMAVERATPEAVQQFSDWSDGRLWIFDHLGRIAPDQVLAVVRYFAHELRGSHIVIDSMMMVCASEEHLDEQKQLVTDLVRVAQECSVHIHLVAHCRKPSTRDGEEHPPSKYELRGSAAISDQCHNVITVWADKAKQQAMEERPGDQELRFRPDALVSVHKQRNGRWEGSAKLWFCQRSLRFMDEAGLPARPYRLGGEE